MNNQKTIRFFCDDKIDTTWRLCGDAHVYFVLSRLIDFLARPLQWRGNTYELKLEKVTPQPIVCGQLTDRPDFIIDRLSFWNNYYSCLAQSNLNSLVGASNCNYTMRQYNKHSTSDVLARIMHPQDHLPTTLLLPESDYLSSEESSYMLLEVMDKHFSNRYPVFLKRVYDTGGGADVVKVKNFEELYINYRRSGCSLFHLQEAIEDFDEHIRCMAIGPQVLPMKFHMDKSWIEQKFPTGETYIRGYEPELVTIDRQNKDLYQRLGNYVKFNNSYHRWTYASFEALIKNERIHPIDFANPHCDSRFYTLHAHFPWFICALLRWASFCAVTNKNMGVDLAQQKTLEVLNDPQLSALEKYEFCQQVSEAYFEPELFTEFCAENWSDLDLKMIEFYDSHWSEVIEYAIKIGYSPLQTHKHYQHKYRELMDKYFRPNAKEYLNFNIY